MISLTQSTTPIIGQVAWALGKIMNFLFLSLDAIGIANIGLAIILFTIVIKVLMLPLTIKQQKYTKLTNVMNPELQEIRKKYKGKKDQASITKMNEEQKKVYEKYGTSPTGGCLQIFIQMPILFALYKVVQNIPAYVPSLKALYANILDGGLMSSSGFSDIMSQNFMKADYSNINNVIDVMNKFSIDNWNKLIELFPNYQQLISDNLSQINQMNNFLGVNISQNPGFKLGFAILIPILAGFTQWLSVKLQQGQAPSMGDDDNPAAASMKMMTTIMPVTSAIFAVSLPAGLGLYWIAQSVVQIILQLAVNRHIDRIGLDKIIRTNVEKNNKKIAKKTAASGTISNNAKVNTKNTVSNRQKDIEKVEALKKKREESNKAVKEIIKSGSTNNTKKGSLAEKAGMVNKYNQKNSKK